MIFACVLAISFGGIGACGGDSGVDNGKKSADAADARDTGDQPGPDTRDARSDTGRSIDSSMDAGMDTSGDAGRVPPAWTRLFGSPTDDFANGVATDNEGNVYVSGFTTGDIRGDLAPGEQSGFLAKYDASGDLVWGELLGTPGGEEIASGVATDGNGNIYVAGFSKGDLGGQTNNGAYDAFVAKFDTEGARQWVRLIGSPSSDFGEAIATDDSGGVYIAGRAYGAIGETTHQGNQDSFIAKFDASGTREWVDLLGTPRSDAAFGVAADQMGNIYAVGATQGDLGGETNSGAADAFVARYKSDGTRRSVRLLGTTEDDWMREVTTDSEGTLYTVGSTAGNLGGQSKTGDDDGFLAKFGASGGPKWVRLVNTSGGTSGIGELLGVATGGTGEIFVTGTTEGDFDGASGNGADDIVFTSYDDAGNKISSRLFGTADNDQGVAVAVDNRDAIFIAGYTDGELDGQTPNGGFDAFVLRVP